MLYPCRHTCSPTSTQSSSVCEFEFVSRVPYFCFVFQCSHHQLLVRTVLTSSQPPGLSISSSCGVGGDCVNTHEQPRERHRFSFVCAVGACGPQPLGILDEKQQPSPRSKNVPILRPQTAAVVSTYLAKRSGNSDYFLTNIYVHTTGSHVPHSPPPKRSNMPQFCGPHQCWLALCIVICRTYTRR